MQLILCELEALSPWKESMRKACRFNKLNVELVSYFTPLRLRAAYRKFQQIYEHKSQEGTDRWIENELKAFYWVAVAVSCLASVAIVDFKEEQWGVLRSVFSFKNPLTLEYELKKLTEDSATRRPWGKEEESVLAQVVGQSMDKANKWNEFARQLYEQSERRFLRTGKQCRERWLNHLDPSKVRGEWSDQEQKEMVLLLKKEGLRWSLVAKRLGNRTEHMVKNRYKTILARMRKIHPHIKDEQKLLELFTRPSSNSRIIIAEPQREAVREVFGEDDSDELPDHEPQPQEGIKQWVQDLAVEDEDERRERGAAAGNEMVQVYSPWLMNVNPFTPNFSPSLPFFYSNNNFSAFEASLNQQFIQKHEEGSPRPGIGSIPSLASIKPPHDQQ